MEFRPDPVSGKNLWRTLENTTISFKRKMEVRASSLPFCLRAYYLDHKIGPLTNEENFPRDMMTIGGRGVHSALQQWLGRAGVLFGMWACPLKAMKNTKGVRLCDQSIGPRTLTKGETPLCPKHSLALEYEELEVRYDILTGHPDGLLTWNGKPPFTLLEFKTISTELVDGSGWIHLDQPKEEHVEQTTAYGTIISEHGLKIGGKLVKYPIDEILIAYFWRDMPWRKPKMWSYDIEPQRFYSHVKTIEQLKKAIKYDKLPDRGCGDRDPWCPYDPICCLSNDKLKQILEEISHVK